jgi:hypothetical protein
MSIPKQIETMMKLIIDNKLLKAPIDITPLITAQAL